MVNSGGIFYLANPNGVSAKNLKKNRILSTSSQNMNSFLSGKPEAFGSSIHVYNYLAQFGTDRGQSVYRQRMLYREAADSSPEIFVEDQPEGIYRGNGGI